jgi:hypothetical protein
MHFFHIEARHAGLITLVNQIAQKVFVGCTAGKIARPPHAQRLIHSLFEAMMGLLDVAILVGDADIVKSRFHPIVRHEGLIPARPLLALAGGFLPDRSRQVISAVLLGEAPDGPQTGFDAFGQGLKALAEADHDGLHIGVGQHQVKEQVGKGFACQCHVQVIHVRKIGLCPLARLVALFKDHVFVWPM